MTDPRPSWDTYGLHLARAASFRADCTRRLVGAALLGADHRVLSLGYNGAPSGVPGCLSAGACPRGQFTYAEISHGLGNTGHAVPCIAVHAERNCLQHLIGDRPRWEVEADLTDSTLFITDAPCPECRTYVNDVADTYAHFSGIRVVTPLGVHIAL